MKAFQTALTLTLLLNLSSHTRANDYKQSDSDTGEIKSWLYSYLAEHKTEKEKVSNLIRAITQNNIDNEMLLQFKDSPPGVRSFVSAAILMTDVKTYYSLISTGKQNWMCRSLIENAPDEGPFYPILVQKSNNNEYLDDILGYCITPENAATWSSFVLKIEPQINLTAKPIFDEIRKAISLQHEKSEYKKIE